MIPRVVLALAVLLTPGSPAWAASAAAYDSKSSPLDELSRDLLTTNGYEFREDGKIWDKISEVPVPHKEMPYLLSHLAGARRLRALLQLNLILNRSEGEKKLTDAERESVRALVRQNWPVFGVGTRRDFRAYFSVRELEELDKIPPRFDKASAISSMKDPEPESVTASPPPVLATPEPAAPAPQAVVSSLFPPMAPVAAPAPTIPAAPAVPPVQPQYIPSLTPMFAPPSLRRPSPFSMMGANTPQPETPAPAPAAPPTPAEPVAPAVAAPAPAPVPVPLAPTQPDIGVLKPWIPPAVSTPAAVAEAVAVTSVTFEAPPAEPAPPPAPAPPQPAIPVVGAEQYEKFVAEGPYTAEGKALLHLLGTKAPDYCLPLLRRTVLSTMPQIVLDGARTGTSLRAGMIIDPAKPDAPPVVALSPGAVYVERKIRLFGPRQALVLPESPSFYAELGIPMPALDALRKAASPTGVENGPWGAAKVFADDSRRGSYSSQEQAGELLEQILLLGLKREGLDASAYAAKRWTRTARLLFSSRVKEDLGHDGFLDIDRRAELREWMERPEESDDALMSSWAGSRTHILDPRRGAPENERDFESRARGSCVRSSLEDALAEAGSRRARRVGTLETLLGAELAPEAEAKASAQAAADAESAERKRLLASPPACPPADAGRGEALRKASLLAAEALRAERMFREKKASGEGHED